MRKMILLVAMPLQLLQGYSQSIDSISKITFGFNVGLNYSTIQLKNADPAFRPYNAGGFRIEISTFRKFGKYLTFAPKTGLSFNDTKLEFQKNNTREIFEICPFLIEIATHVNCTFYNGKSALYFVFGPSYKIPVNEDKKVKYATNRLFLAIDIGFGLDRKFKYFILAPELRYSYGLRNLNSTGQPGQFYFHTVSLLLNFKG